MLVKKQKRHVNYLRKWFYNKKSFHLPQKRILKSTLTMLKNFISL